MTANLYRNGSSDPKTNAQRNLCGRTHYVDEDTLRWHKSRVLAARAVDHGLLFAITTSDAIDPPSSWTGKTPRRGFRYVIFDIFGNVLARPALENTYRRREQCDKAMWVTLNALDAKDHTRKAIEEARKAYNSELDRLAETIEALEAKAA